MISKSEIKLIKSLADRSARSEHGLFVAEGVKIVAEAAVSGLEIVKIFHTADVAVEQIIPDFTGGQTSVGDFKARAGIPVEVVSAAEMERISHLKTPPGILALLAIPHHGFDIETTRRNLVLALDGVQDPGNLGTIIRIADWFGIGDIICSPGSADCYNPKVVQATMGALLRVRVHYIPLAEIIAEAADAAKLVEAAGAADATVGTSEAAGAAETKTNRPPIGTSTIPVYGAVLCGGNIYEAPLSGTGIIVMGSESHGISAEVENLLTHKLLIPPYPVHIAGKEDKTDIAGNYDRQTGAHTPHPEARIQGNSTHDSAPRGSESLNVAVATAIICSEFRRRR